MGRQMKCMAMVMFLTVTGCNSGTERKAFDLARRAEEASRRGDSEEAQELVREALALDLDTESGKRVLGLSLFRQGAYLAAVEAYGRCELRGCIEGRMHAAAQALKDQQALDAPPEELIALALVSQGNDRVCGAWLAWSFCANEGRAGATSLRPLRP